VAGLTLIDGFLPVACEMFAGRRGTAHGGSAEHVPRTGAPRRERRIDASHPARQRPIARENLRTTARPVIAQAGADAGSPQAGAAAADGGVGAVAPAGVGGNASPVPASLGCGSDPPAADTSLQIGGVSASYLVDLPTGYDKTRPYPLVMAFRGSGVTAEQFRARLNLPQATGNEAILVHPNCVGDASSWDVQRDLPLFDMLLAQTVARYCVDERRVFAAGQEFGGYFTSMLGCLRADKLRAIASFAPGVPPTATCPGELAVWIAQSNADPATAVANARNTSSFWGKHNGCDVTISMAVDPKPCIEYASCHAGVAVRYCEYDGTTDLPAFAASGVWSFFKGL
jgi:poly(3-hydroxybutyrate) depolymerase